MVIQGPMSEGTQAAAKSGAVAKSGAAVKKGSSGKEERLDTNASLFGLRGRSIELPSYSGPLDLLLKLIRKNEIDIYDIPIASITEQYLVELEAMEKQDLLLAGDFLLMASTLLEIKSAMMLPRPPLPGDQEEAKDPRAALVQHLLEYQAFQVIAEHLGQLESQRRLIYGRPFSPTAMEEYGPLRPTAPNLNLDGLCRSLQRMLERLESEGDPITSIPRQQAPLRLRLGEVLAELALAGPGGMLLEELARPLEGRLFVIVTFLAILELLRSGKVWVQETKLQCTHRFWLARFKGEEKVGIVDG